VRIVSVICGFPGVARATWGRWLAHRAAEAVAPGGGPLRSIVPPGPTPAALRRAVAFADRGEPPTPVLAVPEPEDVPEAFASLRGLASESAGRALGLITEPVNVMKFLQDGAGDAEAQAELRQALVGGLVVLDQHVESVLDQSVLRQDERPLYRSDHEQILHKLLVHDGAIPEDFQTNHRVRARSAKRYEVDLWCETLRLALEVDGGQHVSNDRQRRRDAERDADLAGAGILTVRVHASEVISDPSTVLSYVRSQIETRRTEMTS